MAEIAPEASAEEATEPAPPARVADRAAARDPGLQAERTALAWNRTALAVVVNALLTLRTGWVNGEDGITAMAVALLLVAAWVMVYGRRRRRQLLEGGQLSAAPPLAIAATATAAFLTCLFALLASIVLAFD